MPRLLMVTTVPKTLDGFLLPFATHFRRLGWTVDALTGAGDGGLKGADRFDRSFTVVWSRSPLDFHNLLLAPRRVREVVAQGRYDLVHVHTPVAAFVVRFALRNVRGGAGPRVVYTAHGFHFHPGASPVRTAPYLALEKLAARWTDELVVINREDEAAARRWRFLPPDRIRLIPGIGVDLAHYSPARVDPADVAAVRRELGVGDDPCFLMVAEFNRGKRHADMLRAFAAVALDRSLPRAHLLLAGSGGNAEAAVRAQVARLDLGERVHFLGFRPDVPAIMRACVALALPSEREGLPRSVLEAMAMGLPVVGTRIRGTHELLDDGCGYLHDVGDADGLAAHLRRVLLDPVSALRVAERARAKVARYDLQNVVRLHEQVYADALKAPPLYALAT